MTRVVLTYSILICTLFSVSVANAQQVNKADYSDFVDSTSVTVYFSMGSTDIDTSLAKNKNVINKLQSLAERQKKDASIYVPRLDVFSYVSPEDPKETNAYIRKGRLDNAIAFISSFINLPKYSVTQFSAKETLPVTWKEMSVLVRRSDIPNKQAVLNICEQGDKKLERLYNLDKDHSTYEYIKENIFPELRRCKVVVYFKNKKIEVKQEAKNEITEVVEVKKEDPAAPVPAPPVAKKEEPKKDAPKKVVRKDKVIYKPVMAFNTNIAYDAVMALNLGIEAPIKDRGSLNASVVFPWYKDKDDKWCIQMFYGELEGKVWMGDRSYKEALCGHALGLFVGAGLYDFERHENGFQSDLLINFGLTWHYAKYFGRNDRWRFQFGIGLGALITKWKYYENDPAADLLVWKKDGHYNWIGPTKLDLNIGYLLHRKVVVKKGGDDNE